MNLQFLVRQRGRLPEKSPRACADAWKEAHVLCSAIYPGAHIFRVCPPFRTFFISALPRQLVHQFGPFALHDRTHVIGK
jgi:hypothetical protein